MSVRALGGECDTMYGLESEQLREEMRDGCVDGCVFGCFTDVMGWYMVKYLILVLGLEFIIGGLFIPSFLYIGLSIVLVYMGMQKYEESV